MIDRPFLTRYVWMHIIIIHAANQTEAILVKWFPNGTQKSWKKAYVKVVLMAWLNLLYVFEVCVWYSNCSLCLTNLLHYVQTIHWTAVCQSNQTKDKILASPWWQRWQFNDDNDAGNEDKVKDQTINFVLYLNMRYTTPRGMRWLATIVVMWFTTWKKRCKWTIDIQEAGRRQ